MQDSKLIQLLFKLKKKELKSFHHFLCSPYHNTNKQVISLFECVSFYHPEVYSPRSKKSSNPDKIHAGLKKERVFRKMHDKKADYHEGRLNVIASQLVQLLFDFFAFEEVKKDNYHLEKMKLKVYRNLKMNNTFFKAAEKIKMLILAKKENEAKHLEAYLLNKEIVNHPKFNLYQSGGKELKLMLQSLDDFFIWEKLRLSVKAYNREQVVNEHYTIELLLEVLSNFKDKINQSTILFFYKKLIEFYQNEETNILNSLINNLDEISAIMPKAELKNNLISILNIIALKCRNGETHLKHILFDLYKRGLELKLFFNDENISDVIFINIVTLGGGCGEFEWATEFIATYESYLNPLCKEDTISLSKAYLDYHRFTQHKKEELLDSIIKDLQSIHFKRPFMAYRAKILLFRVHYENSLNINVLVDFSNAFERQIKRDKSLVGNKKASFSSFIQLTRRLIKLKFNKNRQPSALNLLRQDILSKKNLFAKDWLIEKIGELESSP